MTDRRKRLNFYLKRLWSVVEDWETDLKELAANGAITDSDLEDESAVIEVLSNSVNDINLILQDDLAPVTKDAKEGERYHAGKN